MDADILKWPHGCVLFLFLYSNTIKRGRKNSEKDITNMQKYLR